MRHRSFTGTRQLLKVSDKRKQHALKLSLLQTQIEYSIERDIWYRQQNSLANYHECLNSICSKFPLCGYQSFTWNECLSDVHNPVTE